MKIKKLGNLKLRTKIEAFVAASLLLLLIVGGVIAVNRSISSTSDNLDTFIRCSNGNYYTATASNLQTAINSLNGSDSKVVIVGGDITTTSTIYVNDNLTLDFYGHKLSMQAGTNKNIIENYDNSSKSSYITIKNGILDGIDTTLNDGKMGIVLVNVTNCRIMDVDLHNVYWGIAFYEGTVSAMNEHNEIRSCSVDWCNSGFVIDGNYNTVDTCYVYNSSAFDFYARKSSIGHNYWTNIHGHGVQSGSPTGEGLGIAEYDSQYQTVIGGSFYGNYPEDCVHITSKGDNCTISNIVVHNTHASGDGFYSSGKHVKFDNCVAYSCGGRGFNIAGEHTTLDNIRSYNNDKEGILFGTASDYSSCINSEIFNNSQDGAGTYGNINIYQPDNISIHNCDIYDTSATVQYGIKEGGTADYNFFTDNSLYGTFTAGNLYKIGSNTVVRNNVGYETTFPTANVTTFQAGYAWFNTATNILNVYNGTAWVSTTFT